MKIVITISLFVLLSLMLVGCENKKSFPTTERIEKSFRKKIAQLNKDGNNNNVDIELIAQEIKKGAFSKEEVLFWLQQRLLSVKELERLKNGEILDDRDRDACFYFLGSVDPDKALEIYFGKFMNVKYSRNDKNMLIPERQDQIIDQYLNAILHGWQKFDRESQEKWKQQMQRQFKLGEKPQ